jgi:hypothetical protein
MSAERKIRRETAGIFYRIGKCARSVGRTLAPVFRAIRKSDRRAVKRRMIERKLNVGEITGWVPPIVCLITGGCDGGVCTA